MSNDPYVMEETCAGASRALGSSLWEVWALRRHAAPALAAAAASVFAAADPRAQPVALAPPDLAAVGIAVGAAEPLPKPAHTFYINTFLQHLP